jgi:hypothetical protein
MMKPEAVERRQCAAAKVTADRNFNELEGFGSGMADDPRTGFYQPGLQAGQ